MTLALDRCEIESVGSDPVRLASALLKQLPDVTRAVPIEEVALALDIVEIVERPFKSIEAVLQTDRCKSQGMIGVRVGAHPQRQRFSIAHELGHFLNERHKPTTAGGFTCTKADMRTTFGDKRHARQEREANKFAAEALLPHQSLASFLRSFPDLGRALTIVDRFDVSLAAAARRYVDLHRDRLAVVFSGSGRLRYLHRPDDFPWIRLKPGEPIGEAPTPSASGDRLSDMDEVDAESWLERSDGLDLYAQTIQQANGFAVTMLLAEARDPEEEDAPRFRK